jgi:hypothetical protein
MCAMLAGKKLPTKTQGISVVSGLFVPEDEANNPLRSVAVYQLIQSNIMMIQIYIKTVLIRNLA